MKIRPGRSTRTLNSQAWSRYSVRKPRKNFIKALPHTSLLIFNMGTYSDKYDLIFTLNSRQRVQLRSNALEAARQSANKLLEKEIPGAYYFKVITYPHNVLREKKFATGAGADRVSQGMSNAFGRPTAVAARVFENQPVFEIRVNKDRRDIAKAAMKRASLKLSGSYYVSVKETNPIAKLKISGETGKEEIDSEQSSSDGNANPIAVS